MGASQSGEPGIHANRAATREATGGFELEYQEGVTKCELADKLEITRATITNLLNCMESSGLIFHI